MEPLLIQGNIVLIAPDHSPNVVSKEWLYQKGILQETPIKFVHHHNVSLVETENFVINVLEQQATITALNLDEEILKRLQDVAERYVDALPYVSYNAIGLNTTWRIRQPDPNFLKTRFVTDQDLFGKIFDGNYNVGGIVYYLYDFFRVQLTIAPQREQSIAAFNYHRDVTTFDELIEASSCFVEATRFARKIIKQLLGG